MKQPLSGPFELSVGLEGGLPALMHPGRSQSWWWTPLGPAWRDDERLWVKRGDRVLIVPIGREIDVEPVSDGLVAWTPRGDVLHVGTEGPPITVYGPEDPGVRVRNGADLRAVRTPGKGWRVQAGGRDVPLPEGAVHARDLRPWRRGEGVVWRADTWVFRMARGRSPRAIAEVGDKGAVAVGPHGAVLVGEDMSYGKGAPAGGSARPLPVPLAASPWGLRWSADGRVVAGVDFDGRAVTIDLHAGKVVAEARGALPLDANGRALRGDGTLAHCDVPWTPRETGWALHGDRLGGPGGAVWDLAKGRRCFPKPVLALGVTVPTDAAWATVDWETGDGRWIDPKNGKTLERFEVAVRTGDVLTKGWADGDRAVLETAEGRQWLVEESWTSTPPSPMEPPGAPMPGVVEVDDRLFARGKVGPLPVETAVKRGKRVWAWNTDGLLVALPA